MDVFLNVCAWKKYIVTSCFRQFAAGGIYEGKRLHAFVTRFLSK